MEEIKKRRLTGKAAELTEGFTPESLEETRKKMIAEEKHWQNVRERAAIAALQGAASRSYYAGQCAKFAVECADKLVELLKNKEL